MKTRAENSVRSSYVSHDKWLARQWFDHGQGTLVRARYTEGEEPPWSVRRVTGTYILIVPNVPYNRERNDQGKRRYVLLRWDDMEG